jgi:hypothetical protein
MRWSALRSLRAALLVGAMTVHVPAWGGEPVDVVLAGLPAHGSADYEDLKRLAHAEVSAELPMTRGETWRVPADRLEALKKAAMLQGAAVTPLSETWNHAFVPMSPDSSMTDGQKTMMRNTMRQAPVMGMTSMALPSPEVLENALTKDMGGGGESSKARLVLQLTNQLTITAIRTSIHKTREGYAWHGIIEATNEPVTLIWWADGRLSGNITYRGHIFSVRSLGEGMHAIIELAPNLLPPEHAPMSGRQMRDMGMKKDPLFEQGDASMLRKPNSETRNREDASDGQRFAFIGPGAISGGHFTDPGSRPDIAITVLVAYTKGAARFYSDIERDLIALAVEDANQSFRNSGVGNVQLELVHAYETGYAEVGSHFDHVFAFADKKDGAMDEVHELRDRYRADVAVLIVDNPMGCGLAAQIHASSDRAFAVVDQGCAATSYSLAHEIGHLIGARHDVALDDTLQPFFYGHGFVHETEWRTMMSYKESCGGCPRIPVWSSPAIMIRGVPAGDERSENARVIAEEAARVAAFR